MGFRAAICGVPRRLGRPDCLAGLHSAAGSGKRTSKLHFEFTSNHIFLLERVWAVLRVLRVSKAFPFVFSPAPPDERFSLKRKPRRSHHIERFDGSDLQMKLASASSSSFRLYQKTTAWAQKKGRKRKKEEEIK